MLSMHRFCNYVCLPKALLLRGCGCGLHILPTLLFITFAYINYFYRLIPSASIAFWTHRRIWTHASGVRISVITYFFCLFIFIYLFIYLFKFLPFLLQCKFKIIYLFIYFIFFLIFFYRFYYSANSTLVSLLRFSYFITPYDAQASSALSALILW